MTLKTGRAKSYFRFAELLNSCFSLGSHHVQTFIKYLVSDCSNPSCWNTKWLVRFKGQFWEWCGFSLWQAFFCTSFGLFLTNFGSMVQLRVHSYRCQAETPAPLVLSELLSLFMHLKGAFPAVKDWRGKGLVTEQSAEQCHIFAEKVT